jgi:alpha-1,6-mannosyltransferase
MTKTTPPARIALAALLLSALALLGLYVDMGLRQSLLSPVWVYLFLYSVAFGYYIYAAARLVPNLSQWRGTMPLIFGFAVLFRLAVVFAPPSISTDIYRYVWDGRLILHGMNPYHYAPNAGPLRALRDSAVWIPMEYKAYQDIYMSMSQVFFGLGSFFFGESLTGFKLMYTTLDIGVMALLWRLLVSLKRPPALLVWYAWSPLPITEISLAGHQDVTGVQPS